MVSIRTLALAALLIVSIGCGGGGGGGGEVQTGIRVLHGAIDAVPVDLVVAGQASPIVSDAAFALPYEYSPLPEGPTVVSMTRARTPTDLVTTIPTNATAGERYSLLLYGDNSTFGLRTRLLSDSVPSELSGETSIRIVHATTGALAINATLQAGARSGSLATVQFGSASSYLAVPSGSIRISATRAADGHALSSVVITLEPGKAYTLLFAGEAEYFTKGVLFVDS